VIPDIRPSAALFEGSQDSPECLSDESGNIKFQFLPHSEQFVFIRMTSQLLPCGGLNCFVGAIRAARVCVYIYSFIHSVV